MPFPQLPPGLQKKCDDAIADLAAQLVNYQPSYAAAHGGRLWQGIQTPADTPADNNTKPHDKTRKPTDQAEDWSAITLPASSHCALECHVHRSGDTWSYTIYGTVEIAGQTWRRAVGAGAHDWRDETDTL